MELRRIDSLPPYVFATIRELTLELRRARRGRGRPRVRQPRSSVARGRGREAAGGGARSRTTTATPPRGGSRSSGSPAPTSTGAASASSSIPTPQVVRDHGREGGVRPTSCGCCSSRATRPSSPRRATRSTSTARCSRARASSRCRWGRRGPVREPRGGVGARAAAAARDRPLVPAQPDDGDRRPRRSWSASSPSRGSTTSCVVHDFAYADLGFDGYEPPSILQVPGADEVAVELYTLTKSFSMAGWRVGFLCGNAAPRRRPRAG